MRGTTILAILFMVTHIGAQNSPGNPAYEKALAYYEQKNFDACLTAIRPAIKGDSVNADLRILVAHCHVGKKNYSDAVAHLRAVAEESPERTSVRADIVGLLFQQTRYREARNAGYKYIAEFKDANKPIPADLALMTAKSCLAYGKISEALALARDAKQSDDNNIKYAGLITETRALIATQNFTEADISLSYAESMRDSELHSLLRANIAEITWAAQKFPEDKRSEVVALYEKISRSDNAEIKTAALKNLERVKAVKAP